MSSQIEVKIDSPEINDYDTKNAYNVVSSTSNLGCESKSNQYNYLLYIIYELKDIDLNNIFFFFK